MVVGEAEANPVEVVSCVAVGVPSELVRVVEITVEIDELDPEAEPDAEPDEEEAPEEEEEAPS